MTAQSTSPALNLRKSLVRLAGLVRRFDPPLRRVDFANLVENGSGTTLTGWTVVGDTVASIVGGAFSVMGGSGVGYLSQGVPTVLGVSYLLGGEILSVASQFEGIRKADNSAATVNVVEVGSATVGVKSAAFVATSLESFVVLQNNDQGAAVEFDNISLWEADPSDDAPWLRLPFGHKVGNRGMIVRDGDTLHPSDYEEITLFGQTFIKPLVAPGADTEFSIWCAPEGQA